MPSVCSKSSEESALARCLSIEAEQRLPPMTMTGSKNSAEKDWLSLSVNCAADRFWAARKAFACHLPVLRTSLRLSCMATHILKPVIQGLEGTVENELFCLRLAGRRNLPVPAVEMRWSGETAFLLIERYDRARTPAGHIDRLHQEDFCQALSIPPELKYEEEGGPGTERSIDLINRACGRPAADRLRFIRMLLLQYLVGNADAHGKNYALLYHGNTPDLAPLYDVVCTAAYPRLAKKLAMKIGGRAVPNTIQLKHWLTLVPDTKAAQRLLISDIANLAGNIDGEAAALLVELSDAGVQHPILKTVRGVIATRAAHLLRIIDRA